MTVRVPASAIILLTTAASLATAQEGWPPDPDAFQITRYATTAAPVCTEHTPRLTTDSLGPLVPGQTLSDIRQRCPHLAYGWDWGDEGVPTPAVLVRLGDLLAEIEFDDTLPSSLAYRISTVSPQAQTLDGYGPGSLLREMADAWGAPEFGVGECVLYAWFKSRPGLSFRVVVPKAWDCADLVTYEESSTSRPLPADTKVQDVLLFRPRQ